MGPWEEARDGAVVEPPRRGQLTTDVFDITVRAIQVRWQTELLSQAHGLEPAGLTMQKKNSPPESMLVEHVHYLADGDNGGLCDAALAPSQQTADTSSFEHFESLECRINLGDALLDPSPAHSKGRRASPAVSTISSARQRSGPRYAQGHRTSGTALQRKRPLSRSAGRW